MIFAEESTKGLILKVFVQPKASKSELVGIHNEMLKIKIAAPPVDGEANEAVIEFLSKTLSRPKRDFSIVGGQTSRRKRVLISTMTKAELLLVFTKLNFDFGVV